MNLSPIFQGIRSAKDVLQRKHEQIEARKRRREDLRALPAPRKELADMVCSWVDERAKAFPGMLRSELAFFFKHPLRLQETSDGGFTPNAAGAARMPALLPASTLEHRKATPDAALLYLLAEPLKASLRKCIEVDMDYPEVTAPLMKARVAEIEKLDKEIAELEEETRSMEQELAAAIKS